MAKKRETQSNLLAIDLDTESGRVIIGHFNGSVLKMEEIHRFANGPVQVGGKLFTDVLYLWSEILTGLQKAAKIYKNELVSICVDTWGVDYALQDKTGELLGNPYHSVIIAQITYLKNYFQNYLGNIFTLKPEINSSSLIP